MREKNWVFDLKYKIDNYPSLSINSNIDSMQKLISYFNQEYKWDEMFTMPDVLDRISNGHKLFTLSYNNESIGYVWFKKINKSTCYLYNLYVTNIIHRPNYSPVWFIHTTCSEMLKYYKKIECDCEDWHNHAHNVFISNGFIEV